MRKLLRYLRAAWLYSQHFPYVEDAEAEGYWNEEDASNLARFFHSHTGKKLSSRLYNYAIKSALSAVKNPGNSQYNNGVAAGIPMLIVAIESHFPAEPETDEEERLTALEERLAQA